MSLIVTSRAFRGGSRSESFSGGVAMSAALVAALILASAGAEQRFQPARLSGGDAPALPSELRVGWEEALLEVAVDPSGNLADLTLLRGTLPFVDVMRDVVARWRFEPATADGQPTESSVLVAAVFRPRTLFNNPTLGEPSRQFGEPSEAAPFPTSVVPASYPPMARGDGVVLVEVLVSPNGTVTQAKVIGSAAGFDQAALAAARQWAFRPARRRGARIPTIAYLVFGFRSPVIVREQPTGSH